MAELFPRFALPFRETRSCALLVIPVYIAAFTFPRVFTARQAQTPGIFTLVAVAEILFHYFETNKPRGIAPSFYRVRKCRWSCATEAC